MDCNQYPITSCYYATLGVNRNSSISEIRRAYRKLAMRWHPDRWTRRPSLLGEAQKKFQQIQEAYAVLSDQRKRSLYDAGLYNANDDDYDDEEEDNGFSDFLQEMLSLMTSVKREGKVYSLEELRQMLTEMAQGVDISQLCDGEESLEDSRASKRARWSSSLPRTIRSSHVCVSDLGLCR